MPAFLGGYAVGVVVDGRSDEVTLHRCQVWEDIGRICLEISGPIPRMLAPTAIVGSS